MADEITLKEFIERIFAERENQLQLHFRNSENAMELTDQEKIRFEEYLLKR